MNDTNNHHRADTFDLTTYPNQLGDLTDAIERYYELTRVVLRGAQDIQQDEEYELLEMQLEGAGVDTDSIRRELRHA